MMCLEQWLKNDLQKDTKNPADLWIGNNHEMCIEGLVLGKLLSRFDYLSGWISVFLEGEKNQLNTQIPHPPTHIRASRDTKTKVK